MGFGAAGVMVGVVATFGLAELGARLLNFTRVQRVNMDSAVHPYVEDGVLLLRPQRHERLAGLDCLDDEKRVAVFIGDSVMYAAKWDITAEHGNFVFELRERFRGEGWCFVNLSAPGYSGWQQGHLVHKALDTLHPDIIFWGLWKPDGAARDAAAQGVSFVVVDFPMLSRPFAESAVDDWERAVAKWLLEHQVEVIEVASELAGEDYMALRADACCHYNVRGNARLADLYEDRVREFMVGQPQR